METKKKSRRKFSWDLGLMNREKTKSKLDEKESQNNWKYGIRKCDCNTDIVDKINKFSSATELRRTSIYDSNKEINHFSPTNDSVGNSDHVGGPPIVARGIDPGFTTDKGGFPCLWADTVSKELISECKIAFSYFDKNGSGRVTWKDFGKILRNLGQNPTEKEIEDVRIDRILQSGTNGTGAIDFPEFITIIAKRFGIDGANEMESAFRAFDRNGDGLISFAEFKSYNDQIGQFLSDEEINDIIKEVDIDGDGFLNYEEFLKMNR